MKEHWGAHGQSRAGAGSWGLAGVGRQEALGLGPGGGRAE